VAGSHYISIGRSDAVLVEGRLIRYPTTPTATPFGGTEKRFFG